MMNILTLPTGKHSVSLEVRVCLPSSEQLLVSHQFPV